MAGVLFITSFRMPANGARGIINHQPGVDQDHAGHRPRGSDPQRQCPAHAQPGSENVVAFGVELKVRVVQGAVPLLPPRPGKFLPAGAVAGQQRHAHREAGIGKRLRPGRAARAGCL